MKNLINISDITKYDVENLLDLAHNIKLGKLYNKVLDGKIIASCFFEPSTRTRLSFESAILRLGGKIIGFSDAGSTSTRKGESLEDTIRMLSSYADMIVMRHSMEGAAQIASEYSNKPIINAGDGANEHPSQTLLDLFTIKEHHGSIDRLIYTLVGDLKYGRTIHSLIKALAQYNIKKMNLVSPKHLELPEYLIDYLQDSDIEFQQTVQLESLLSETDVLYMTRLQKERLQGESEDIPYSINLDLLETYAKDNLCVMHPLPRETEICTSVDNSKYAKYFIQAENGVYTRAAILSTIAENIC